MRRLLPVLVLGLATPAAAVPEDVSGRSGAPVPRFVSLRSGEANLRTGPGDQYPILWTYRRQRLPVEIVREWGPWRQVRDPDGASGWMNKGLLSGERYLLVTGTTRTLYAEADIRAKALWRAEPGVVARILFCAGDWCRVSAEGQSGFVLRAQSWGSYPGERVE